MKKNLVICFLVITALFAVDLLSPRKYCSITCTANLDGLFLNWLAIALMTTLFLLVLTVLPKRVYEAWWRFTKIALPIFIILVSAQVYTMNLPRGGYNMLNFDPTILASFYIVYILLSFIQIYRGYRNK